MFALALPRCLWLLPAALFVSLVAVPAALSDEAALYDLKYKFTPGEVIRTKVIHQATVKTTIDGTSQTADTVSVSVKRWEVEEVTQKGTATFTHSVEYVDMWNQISGREKISYDSRKDQTPPAGFETVAKEVGVPLTVFQMTARGEVVSRENKAETATPEGGQLTIPLPEEPVAIGHTWEFPYDVPVRLQNGQRKLIKTRQRFELLEVTDGMATISVDTQVLSPVNDPAIEAQLVQRESEGQIQFDIERGRVAQQQIDLDRRIVGYPNDASSMHYRTRFTEELLQGEPQTARRPGAATK